MDRKLIDMLEKIRSNWKFWFAVVYFTTLIVVLAAVYNKNIKKPTPEPPAPAPMVTVDLEPVNKRIAVLEQELAAHAATIKAMKSEIDAANNTTQRVERRLQAHTEAFKRLCEYVLVITVDKKIIPRQCLPEYKWAREEGN